MSAPASGGLPRLVTSLRKLGKESSEFLFILRIDTTFGVGELGVGGLGGLGSSFFQDDCRSKGASTSDAAAD